MYCAACYQEPDKLSKCCYIFSPWVSFVSSLYVSTRTAAEFNKQQGVLRKARSPVQAARRLTHPANRLYTVLALTKPWWWKRRTNNTLIRHLTQWTRACVQNSPVMKLTSETFLPPAPIYHFHSQIIESNLPTHDYTSQEIIFHVR